MHKRVIKVIYAFFVCEDIVAKSSNGTITIIEVLFTNPHLTKLGHPLVAGTAFQTGWILDIILFIMVVFSMDFIRRRGHFQVQMIEQYIDDQMKKQ